MVFVVVVDVVVMFCFVGCGGFGSLSGGGFSGGFVCAGGCSGSGSGCNSVCEGGGCSYGGCFYLSQHQWLNEAVIVMGVVL